MKNKKDLKQKQDKTCDCVNEKTIKFDTENDLNVAIIKDGKDLLINEDCCTCINVMLKNDGQILTSFLGSHNPYIIAQLEQAQKYYFKGLKKALKAQTLPEEYAGECGHHCHCEEDCHCDDECHCDDQCECGDGQHKDCGCEGKHKSKDDCKCKESKNHKKQNS